MWIHTHTHTHFCRCNQKNKKEGEINYDQLYSLERIHTSVDEIDETVFAKRFVSTSAHLVFTRQHSC